MLTLNEKLQAKANELAIARFGNPTDKERNWALVCVAWGATFALNHIAHEAATTVIHSYPDDKG